MYRINYNFRLISDITDDLEITYKDTVGAILKGIACNVNDVKLSVGLSIPRLKKLNDDENFNYQKYEKEVLNKVLENHCSESSVVKDIAFNKEIG